MKPDVSLIISLKRSSLHYRNNRISSDSDLGAKTTYLGGVHLVDRNNELTDTEGERKKGVLAGLAVLGDTSLELTGTTGDDKDGAVSLGGTGDHVLDEVTVARGVNDLDARDQLEKNNN